MTSELRIRVTAFVALRVALANLASATERSTQLAVEAQQVLDARFGSEAQLACAAALLTSALGEDKSDAAVYVQAARVMVKGGYVVATQFRPGTIEAYGELLDRALTLDPQAAHANLL